MLVLPVSRDLVHHFDVPEEHPAAAVALHAHALKSLRGVLAVLDLSGVFLVLVAYDRAAGEASYGEIHGYTSNIYLYDFWERARAFGTLYFLGSTRRESSVTMNRSCSSIFLRTDSSPENPMRARAIATLHACAWPIAPPPTTLREMLTCDATSGTTRSGSAIISRA